jgi:hypothetical protein
MKTLLSAIALCLAFFAGVLVARSVPPAGAATGANPTQGWSLHVDAQKHFGDQHPTEVAHHWCKPVENGMTECQLYNSDAPNATLIGVETIVGPATYKSFSSSEQAMWHYHKDEIPKVNATMPDLSPAEAKKVADSLMDTYGKVWLLYDPMATNNLPSGQPTVVVPH